jgi:hypothetical protein
MSYSLISEKKEIQIATKRKSAKNQTTAETLDCITAKLSTLGISKTTPHKVSQQITLSDGTKIIESAPEYKKCNWCKNPQKEFYWGVPLWIQPDGKTFAVEPAYCSLNCLFAFLNYTDSVKYKDSQGLLHLLLNLIGVEPKEVVPAEHWTKQKEFGGDMEEDQYKCGWLVMSKKQSEEWKKLVVETHRLTTLS